MFTSYMNIVILRIHTLDFNPGLKLNENMRRLAYWLALNLVVALAAPAVSCLAAATAYASTPACCQAMGKACMPASGGKCTHSCHPRREFEHGLMPTTPAERQSRTPALGLISFGYAISAPIAPFRTINDARLSASPPRHLAPDLHRLSSLLI